MDMRKILKAGTLAFAVLIGPVLALTQFNKHRQ